MPRSQVFHQEESTEAQDQEKEMKEEMRDDEKNCVNKLKELLMLKIDSFEKITEERFKSNAHALILETKEVERRLTAVDDKINAIYKEINSKIDAAYKEIDSKIDNLKTSIDATGGSKVGFFHGWGILLGIVGIIGVILTILLNLRR